MDLQKLLKWIKKVCCLPPVPTLLFAAPSFVFVFFVLVNPAVHPAAAYSAYILSAYAMILTVTGAVRAVKHVRTGIKRYPLIKKLSDSPVVDRFMRENMFRAELSLYSGLFINLLYAGIKLFSGIRYRSILAGRWRGSSFLR
ncbi:MAG: hypothetical protein ACI4F3_12650 [Enterocloster sp.]